MNKWNIFWTGFEYEVTPNFRNDSRKTLFTTEGEIIGHRFVSVDEEKEISRLIQEERDTNK